MAELFDIRTYDYTKVKDVLDIPETWTPVVIVSGTTIVGKVYELKMAVSGKMADVNDTASIRYRVDGGTWFVTVKEAKSLDDTFNADYFFPYVATLATTTLEIEATKEAGGGQFDIHFADAIIERKT